MAIYTVELDGKRYDIEGDRPPTEKEARDAIGNFSSQNNTPSGAGGSFDKPQSKSVDEKISQRQSAVETLRQEVTQPWQPVEHPIKTLLRPLITGMKTIAVPLESAESAIANPIREMNNNPNADARSILGSIVSGITQKKQGQFGDIARDFSIPEPIAATMGLLTSGAVGEIASSGRLMKSANQAKDFVMETARGLSKSTEEAIRKNFPRIILDDKFVLQQAEKASQGLDDLYKGLSSEYEKLYNEVGNKLVPINKIQEVLSTLPDSVINKFNNPQYRNLFSRYQDQSIIPSLENLKAMKTVLRQSVPEKVWNGRAMGDMNTSSIEQAYGKFNDIMAEAAPELKEINSRYKDFMNMRKTIGKYIWDENGNVVGNKLKAIFTDSGEAGHKQFFEAFAKQWEPANDVIKGIKDYNSRKAAAQFLSKKVAPAAGYAAVGGAAGAGISALVNK